MAMRKKALGRGRRSSIPIEFRGKDVVKNNALVEAFYKPLTIWESRLFHMCLAQVASKKDLSHTRTFVVSAQSLAKLTRTNERTAYRMLRIAAGGLEQFSIEVRMNHDGTPVLRRTRNINVISQCDYVHNKGRVELQFTHSFIPFISRIKGRFTKYQPLWIVRFTCRYTVRVYELCLRWKNKDNKKGAQANEPGKMIEIEIPIDEFRELMGIEPGRYERLESLRSRVIEPSIIDINRFSDMLISSPSTRKKGRRVTHLIFTFRVLTDDEIEDRLTLYGAAEADYTIPLEDIQLDGVDSVATDEYLQQTLENLETADDQD